MNRMGRRAVMAGAVLIGAGGLFYGGSLTACLVRDRRLALVEPLFAALGDMHAPDEIGRAWLRAEGAENVLAGLIARRDLRAAALAPDAEVRRHAFSAAIRRDFDTGDTVLAAGWVAARSEARIAAAWIAAG